ncbi:sensor histidine kinase [Melissococcus plutonius]|uniref:sensor histidine kinase n=1 Tax=Melissococcus plutonius TaxID=33970 RepID=UPI003C2CC831
MNKQLLNKKMLLNRLVKKYAFILVALILISLIGLGLNIYLQFKISGNEIVTDIAEMINRSIEEQYIEGHNILNELTNDQKKLTSLDRYMNTSISEYLNYSYTPEEKNGSYFFLPSQIQYYYTTNPNIESIMIVLNNYNEFYLSTKQNKGGQKIKGIPKLSNQFYLAYPITNLATLKVVGTFYIKFSSKDIINHLSQQYHSANVSAYIFSNTNHLLFYYNNLKGKKDTKNQMNLPFIEKQTTFINRKEKNNCCFINRLETKKHLTIFTAVTKKSILRHVLGGLQIVLIGSIILMGILLYLLFRTFTNYSRQVSTILYSMTKVSQGNIHTRIDEKNIQYELQDVASGINRMLDSMEQYIADIYKLKIKQQEANMRALQSQIHPHFLYNTLEYIRMYALSEGGEELAEVVYVFSALLRNTIDQTKTITLEQELNFCEKYVFLYQMRYPNQITYKFELVPELKNLILPKFSIQPLIENYFVHGIDLTREDNAIRVWTNVNGQKVEIYIEDNGKGVTTDRLLMIQKKLMNHQGQLSDSIGIQNVNERLRIYFGSTFLMTIQQNREKGLTLKLCFEKEN